MGKVAEQIPGALSTDAATAEPAVLAITAEMQAFLAADVVYTRRTRGAHQPGARRPRHRRADDPGLEFLPEPRLARRRRPSRAGSTRTPAAARAPTRRRSRRRRARTATACSASASATSRWRPATNAANRLPASSNVTFNVEDRQPGREQRGGRRRAGHDPRRRQDDHRAEDRRPDDARARRSTVAVPLGQAPPIGAGVKITVEVRKVPGEDEHDQQQGRVPGDLPPQLIAARRRHASRSRLPCAADGCRAQLHGRDRRARRRPRSRSSRVCLCAVLFAQLRRCAPTSARCSASRGAGPRRARRRARRLVSRAARLRRAASPSASTAGCRRRAAPRRRDRPLRPDPLRRLQRDVRPPVDVDRAARQPALGRRAVLDPPPRPGSAVRQADLRGQRRAAPLARGGGSPPPRAARAELAAPRSGR